MRSVLRALRFLNRYLRCQRISAGIKSRNISEKYQNLLISRTIEIDAARGPVSRPHQSKAKRFHKAHLCRDPVGDKGKVSAQGVLNNRREREFIAV